MQTWSAQNAEARFNELLDACLLTELGIIIPVGRYSAQGALPDILEDPVGDVDA